MFDLITGRTKHMPRGGGVVVLLSSLCQFTLLGVVVITPILFVTDILPAVPTMMAFVAPSLSVPPPPPPPPPPPSPPRLKDQPATVATSNVNAAPVEAPSRIDPEPARSPGDEGTAEGVEGGIPGGLVGGITGGIPVPPPPPPPPPPRPPDPPQTPVRIGGEIRPPVLLHRVEPIYPGLAVSAHVEGIVILEAIIDTDGTVQSLKVLRSVPLLDKAAVTAVEQWRYSPVMLNGRPVPAILTVVVSFKFPQT